MARSGISDASVLKVTCKYMARTVFVIEFNPLLTLTPRFDLNKSWTVSARGRFAWRGRWRFRKAIYSACRETGAWWC